MIQSSQGEMKFSGSRKTPRNRGIRHNNDQESFTPRRNAFFVRFGLEKRQKHNWETGRGRSRREETSKNSKAAFLFSSSTRKYLRGVRSRGEKGNRPRPRPTTGWKVKGRKLQPEPINVHIEFFRQTHPAPDYGRDNVIRNNFIYVYISSRPNADIHVSNFISRGRVSRVLFHVDCAAINA